MGGSDRYQGPARELALYEAVVATRSDIPRRGAKNPFTSLNNRMTSFLDAAGAMGLRLSPEDREAFMADYGTGLATQYGATMREFVVVPPELLADTAALAPWFERSLAWVEGLPPKA